MRYLEFLKEVEGLLQIRRCFMPSFYSSGINECVVNYVFSSNHGCNLIETIKKTNIKYMNDVIKISNLKLNCIPVYLML